MSEIEKDPEEETIKESKDEKKGEKKYYWFQMQKDWYNDLKRKKMKKQPDGHAKIVIYYEMIGYSCENFGVIRFQNDYDTIEEEIAEMINEDEESVKNAIAYFKKNKIVIEHENKDLYIPEAADMVQSRTQGADRQARYREKMKRLNKATQDDISPEVRERLLNEIHELDRGGEILQDNEGVTQGDGEVTQGDGMVTQGDGEVTERLASGDFEITRSDTYIDKDIENSYTNSQTLKKDKTPKNNTHNNTGEGQTEVQRGDREKEVVRGKGGRGVFFDEGLENAPDDIYIKIKTKQGERIITNEDYDRYRDKYQGVNVGEALYELAEFYLTNPEERIDDGKLDNVIRAWFVNPKFGIDGLS